jgi:hypothetical protein
MLMEAPNFRVDAEWGFIRLPAGLESRISVDAGGISSTKQPLRVETRSRAPKGTYWASVSPSVRSVSAIVRRTPVSVSANVRRKRRSIARLAVRHCAPLHIEAWRRELVTTQVRPAHCHDRHRSACSRRPRPVRSRYRLSDRVKPTPHTLRVAVRLRRAANLERPAAPDHPDG